MKPPGFNATLFVILLQVSRVSAQDISFQRVDLPDINIQNVITGITQDFRGNIWFTSNGFSGGSGLFEYDGVHLKSYTHDPLNPSSLASNYTRCICTDNRGNLWIGTWGDGLEKLDPATGIFIHYKHDAKDVSSISGDTVTCILQDHEGMLWIGTQQAGLNRFDPRTGKFIQYRHNDRDSTTLSFDQVMALYEDREGTLWVGTGSAFIDADGNRQHKGGLNRFNKNLNTFTQFLHNKNDPHSLIDNPVRAIYEDSYGNFWVGTSGDGLHTMDRATGTFTRYNYDPKHPEKLSRPPLSSDVNDHITFITEDGKGAIWIGAFWGGLVRYDPRNSKVERYELDTAHPGDYTNTTWCEFTSRDGEMWVSNFFVPGIFRFDPSHEDAVKIRTGTYLNAFIEEQDSIQWIGTSVGLARVNKKNNDTTWFRHDPKKAGSISNDIVNVLYKDRQNRIWAGTHGGLNLFNPDKQNFTTWLYNKNVSSGLGDSDINAIYEDNESDFWIGTDKGLDKMNLAANTFTHYKLYPEDTAAYGKNVVTSILDDNAHKLWIGSYARGGLNLLNRETNAFKHYLAGKSIVAGYRDSDGNLWAGVEEGLFKYDKNNDSFYLFIDPLTRTTILNVRSIVEDNEKNLWVGSGHNIYRINRAHNEITKVGKDFGVDLSLVFGGGFAFKTHNGQLVFAAADGYYRFSPSIISNLKPPEIILTDFAISDQHVKAGNNNILKEDITTAKQIILNHDQNEFSVWFNVVHYSNPEANKAIYMLENYDKEWRPAGSDRVAYYYNVPPGHYIFRIKAASSYGVWAEKEIAITINAPWWQTWWAYCLYGLLLAAVIFGTHRFQKARIVRAERERTRERELVQAKEIEKAYHELKTTQAQLIQSEKMASLGELTAGIAHEIQNPLNFVNNFSEVNAELIEELEGERSKVKSERNEQLEDQIVSNIKENEQKIIQHGKRADAIVKSMLQHSRISTGQKELTDINALCDEYLRLAYHGMRAKDKSFNVTLETEFDETVGKINVVPQDIGRVLLNLYNNAFYAVMQTKDLTGIKNLSGLEYVPTVTLITKKLNDKIEIRVADNGHGIPKNIVDKIFQPFFTTKPTGQGTGLGLSLSYDIIKAHGGEIKVETKAGTEFIILLPNKENS